MLQRKAGKISETSSALVINWTGSSRRITNNIAFVHVPGLCCRSRISPVHWIGRSSRQSDILHKKSTVDRQEIVEEDDDSEPLDTRHVLKAICSLSNTSSHVKKVCHTNASLVSH